MVSIQRLIDAQERLLWGPGVCQVKDSGRAKHVTKQDMQRCLTTSQILFLGGCSFFWSPASLIGLSSRMQGSLKQPR